MLTLFHAPRSRSSRFIWLLEELGTPYEIEYVNIQRGDGSGAADPVNPHPDRQVPALTHDGVLITESVAIALYLTDAFPEAGIGPVVGDPDRGAYLTWLAHYAGVMEPAITAHFEGRTAAEGPAKKSYEAMDRRFKTTLEAGSFLLGERFSAADIFLASLLTFARQALPDHKCYDDFLARVTARPAFIRAQATAAP